MMRISGSVAVIAILGAILVSELPCVQASLCKTEGSDPFIWKNLGNGLYVTVPNPRPITAAVTLEEKRPDLKNQVFCGDFRNELPYGFYFILDNDDYTIVLDVEGENSNPGAKVIAHTMKNSGQVANQLWRVRGGEERFTVATAMDTGYLLTATSNTLVMQPAQVDSNGDRDPSQLFVLEEIGGTDSDDEVNAEVV